MVCERCNNPVHDKDKFCGTCGAEIPPNAQDVALTEETPTQVHAPRGITARSGRRALTWTATIGALLVLLMGGVATALLGPSIEYVIKYPEMQETFEAENGAEVKVVFVEVFEAVPSANDLRNVAADVAERNPRYDALSIRFYDAQPDGSRPEDARNNREYNGVVSENGAVFVFNSEAGARFGNESEPTHFGEKYEEKYEVGIYVYEKKD